MPALIPRLCLLAAILQRRRLLRARWDSLRLQNPDGGRSQKPH